LKKKFDVVTELLDVSGFGIAYTVQGGVGIKKSTPPETKTAWAALIAVSISV
jgi:hypothetical protein